MLQPTSVLPNGLENIALSFSGGGFRAAAFTLGCVSYLNEVSYKNKPLLHKVKFISSASGGTITNLVLCSMLREGKTFPEIYRHLTGQLAGCDLVDEVFKLMEAGKTWTGREEKCRNFINAFAMVYNERLFKEQTFDIMWKDPDGKFVIDETCTNTTEFNNGLNFRWGTRGDIGNEFLKFTNAGRHIAGKIKLGDILASSSCFTAGFEPIMFPNDFTWESAAGKLTASELRSSLAATNNYNGIPYPVTDEQYQIGFMDGGIDDNQGIYAFLLADNRTSKGYEYDLYFPCDVSSNYLSDPFRYPKPEEADFLKHSIAHWVTLAKKTSRSYLFVTVFLLLMAIGLLCWPAGRWIGGLLLGSALTAAAIPLCLYIFASKKVRTFRQSLPQQSPEEKKGNVYTLVFKKHLGTILKMPVRDLVSMLAARGSSVILLATTVFLKKIRRVSYTLLFKEKGLDVYAALVRENNINPGPIDAGRLWNDHIALTAVYLLSTKNDSQLKKDLSGEPWDELTEKVPGDNSRLLIDFLTPTPALRAVADVATDMGTTLWFDAEDEKKGSLKNLLIAGQATICLNLLRVAFRFSNQDKDWLDLRARLLIDWEKFQHTPDWLYQEYKNPSAIAPYGQA
ncbi:MAG TPA: hypothetical protein VNW04_03995 [Puia sp.]|jgi:hypothetical protein|nr:hypothetical protein [Puia sp.]